MQVWWGLLGPAQSHSGREVRRAPLALDPVPTWAPRGAACLGDSHAHACLCWGRAAQLGVKGSDSPVEKDRGGHTLSLGLPPTHHDHHRRLSQSPQLLSS